MTWRCSSGWAAPWRCRVPGQLWVTDRSTYDAHSCGQDFNIRRGGGPSWTVPEGTEGGTGAPLWCCLPSVAAQTITGYGSAQAPTPCRPLVWPDPPTVAENVTRDEGIAETLGTVTCWPREHEWDFVLDFGVTGDGCSLGGERQRDTAEPCNRGLT